jgi:hypothetical protein
MTSKDEYLIKCARYIKPNPVKTKIAGNPKERPYPAYNVYAYGKKGDII